jgi:hypothetical protein
MTKEEKQEFIFNELEKYNSEFLRQSKMKINRQFCRETSDHIELVSDVLFSVIRKFDNKKDLNKFYVMAKNEKLHLYILKGINTNAKSLNAPFIKNKLLLLNRIQVTENLQYIDDDQPDEERAELVDYLKTLLTPKEAKKIFGDQWELFTKLLKEYTETPSCTYRDLALKYGIPEGSMAWTFTLMKKKIIERAKADKKI